MTLLPELEPTAAEKQVNLARAALARDPSAPCSGCPLSATGARVKPDLHPAAAVVVVAAAPTAADEGNRRLLSDPCGRVLRDAVAIAGGASYVSLTRCRPPDGNFESPVWDAAVSHCRAYLDVDAAGVAPLLLLGARPLRHYAGGRAKIGASRGLWAQTPDGRDFFSVRDPATVADIVDSSARVAVAAEVAADVSAMVDRVLGRSAASPVAVRTFESPFAGRDYLLDLSRRTGPWAFDIETYDAGAFPARKGVSTDPCHPDFRLRGLAVATSGVEGAYFDCRGLEGRLGEVRKILSPAFRSEAPKWAFFGHFDENGLVYPGWVEAVNNRAGDGYLALLALSDGLHDSLRLEHAVVNVLGARQYWNGMDKARMRDTPLGVVAENSVGDACYAFRLFEVLRGRLERGEYMMHGAKKEGF